MKAFVLRHKKKLIALVVLIALPLVAHVAIGQVARLTPPPITLPHGKVTHPKPGLRMMGRDYARRRGSIYEVRLVGTPTEIGYAHSRLLYPEMVENEGIVWNLFRDYVPTTVARTLLLDLAQFRYRHLDEDMSLARRREIAARAAGFSPDPYRHYFPTYQRFVYLDALYDISLSFEHSPLIGCTTFTLTGKAVAGGGTILARNFDFDADDIFDNKKAVFLVEEKGKIPFASVGWPGFIGVVSGMNAKGLAVVVHGGRAGQPRTKGEPVAHALRRVLQTASTTDEAIAALAKHEPMVSHIVIIDDAEGHAAAVERVPGRPNFVRRLGEKAVTTNHFEGPSASDPKNIAVEKHTSTLPRRRRGDELLAQLDHPATIADAVALLRDRRGVGGKKLPLGDRRAINALIATHGVVMDTTHRAMWVSEAPHLLGRFIKFDLRRLLDPHFNPLTDEPPITAIPADPLLTSGRYARWRKKHPKLHELPPTAGSHGTTANAR